VCLYACVCVYRLGVVKFNPRGAAGPVGGAVVCTRFQQAGGGDCEWGSPQLLVIREVVPLYIGHRQGSQRLFGGCSALIEKGYCRL
jgi:hypothetical protein